MKIKVLQVVGQLTIGGQEMMALNFFKYGDRENISMDYVVYGDNVGELEQVIIDLGGRVFHIPTREEIGLKKQKEYLYNTMIQNGPYNVVHSHTYLNNGIVLEVASKANVPIRISHSHNTKSGKKENLKYRIYRAVMKKKIIYYATNLIACGKDAGESFYGKQLFSKHGIVIKNGINLNTYKFDSSIREEVRKKLRVEDKLVIGNISRVTEIKNQQYLIKIAQQLKKTNLNFIFLIAGDGDMLNPLKKMCEEADLQSYFLFLGTRNDVPLLLQGIDIFVLPSLFEGLPVCLIEAQASGLPCIMSRHITQELKLTPNMSFLGIEENDTNKWCEAIIKYSQIERNIDLSKMIDDGYDIMHSCQELSEIYTTGN